MSPRRPTLTNAQRLDRAITERELQDYVEECLTRFRWTFHHANDSRRASAGLPDIIAVRDGVLVVAELKKQLPMPSSVQQRWLDELKRVEKVDTYLWRPSDMKEILEVLR